MPIDLDGLLRRLQAAFRVDGNLTVPLFGRLQGSVQRLDQHAGDLQRAFRDYPILDFFADGLIVRVTPTQRGAIRLEGAVERVGQALTAGLRDFRAGWSWIHTAITQEWAIPRLLGVAQGATGGVAASLARFSEPASLYRPGARVASDLAGELGLVFRTLVSHQGKRELESAYETLTNQPPLGLGLTPKAPAASPAPTGPGAVAGALDDPLAPARALEAVSWNLLGVMLALPIVPALPAIVSAGLRLTHDQFTAVLQRAEAATAPLRQAVAAAMRSMLTMSQTSVAFMDTYGLFIEDAVSTAVGFTGVYLSNVLWATRSWASAVSERIGGWVGIAETIRSVVTKVFSTDLLPLLAAAAGVPLPPGMPALTLEQLAGAGIDAGLAAARGALEVAALALHDVLGDERTAALWMAAKILLTPTPMPVETGLPPPAPPFPDVGAALLDPRWKAEFGSALDRLGHEVPNQVGAILDTGASASAQLAETFHRAAGRAAAVPAGALGDLAGQAQRRVSTAEDLMAKTTGVPPAAPTPDEFRDIGQAFERQLAQGGILMAAAAIPVYAARLSRLWQHQMAEPPGGHEANPAKRQPAESGAAPRRPISPHRLAARARVTTVATPRIVVRLPMAELDDGLMDAVVQAFGQGAAEAWQAGTRPRAAQPTGAGHGR
jgi:hypothetical protein